MLDPGTALAIASIAWDVSKDLLKFLKSWKSCPEDALALRAAILWLGQTFALMHKTLDDYRKTLRPAAESTFDTVIVGVENCKQQIDNLKAEVNRVQSEVHQDEWRKIKNELKRFRYFFSKNTISGMLAAVEKCETNLHVAISLLNLGTVASVLDEVRSLASNVGAQSRDTFLKEELHALKLLVIEQATQADASKQLSLVLKDKELVRALNWLIPLERRKASLRVHNALYRSREFGTGSWFTQGAAFQRWLEEPSSCLWVQGPVGCGKSVLCSTIIHDLQERCYVDEDEKRADTLMYHHFSHKERFLQKAEPLIRSFIAQGGVQSQKSLLVEYYNRYNAVFMPEDPSLDQWTDCLSQILRALSFRSKDESIMDSGIPPLGEVFIVIDALEEVAFGSDRDEVLRFIQSMRDTCLPNLHILLTSRAGAPEKDIADALGLANAQHEAHWTWEKGILESEHLSAHDTAPLCHPITKYSITFNDIRPDIEHVIQKELRTHRRLRLLDEEVKKLIFKILIGRGPTSFREVAVQMSKLTAADVSSETLPEDIFALLGIEQSNTLGSTETLDVPLLGIGQISSRLDELYRQLLKSIPSAHTIMASNAIRWILYSKRSLNLGEFVDICAFSENDVGDLFFSEERRRSPKELFEIFTNLVVADNYSSDSHASISSDVRVSIVHFSVQEYLMKRSHESTKSDQYNMDPLVAHQKIAQCCVMYLMENNNWAKRNQKYALWSYAWNYWNWHCVRTRSYDETSSFIDHELRAYATQNYQASSQEANTYLSRMIWALTGLHCVQNSAELSRCLVLPYFYPELARDIFSGSEIPDKSRIRHDYAPLDDPSRQIRLVTMIPTGDVSSELRSSLEIVADIHEKSFEVITYLWNDGDKESGVSKKAHLRVNGLPHEIPTGLASALKRLRLVDPTRTQRFWIDAVSINQHDMGEKGVVIPRMLQLFQCASAHTLFASTLGRKGDAEALALIKRIDEVFAKATLTEKEKLTILTTLFHGTDVEQMVVSIAHRNIWTRIWILPEIVISRNPTVYYGDHYISIESLERVLLNHRLIEAALLGPRPFTAHNLAQDRRWRALIEMASIRAEFRKENGLLPLRALYATRYLRSTFVLDRLYAILSLVHRNWTLVSQPDYGKDAQEIFVNLGHMLLSQYKNLDMLSFLLSQRLPSQLADLPSWVSTFSVENEEPSPLVTSNITYPPIRDVFEACGDIRTPLTLNQEETKEPNHLILNGYVVDSVLRIFPALEQHDFNSIRESRTLIFADYELNRLCSKRLNADETVISAYWTTMCAGQSRIGKLLPSLGRPGYMASIPTDAARESSWDRFGALLESLRLSEGRRFFISHLGRLGLAPLAAQEKDIVVVCAGGKVPYLLRPSDDATFVIVGDSYVHGIMHGEAVRERGEELMQPLKIA